MRTGYALRPVSLYNTVHTDSFTATIIIIIIIIITEFAVAFPRGGSSSTVSRLEFRSVDFCGGRKTREPREKPSEQGQKPTTNSLPTCDAGSGN